MLFLLAAVLEDPQKYNGKTIPVVGEQISQPEMAQIVSDVTGKNVKCDIFRANMFRMTGKKKCQQ